MGRQRCEEQYAILFEGMAQGAFYQLADGTLTDINPAGLEMLGLSRSEFLNRTSHHPDWKVVDEQFNLLVPEEHPSLRAFKTEKEVEAVVGVFNPLKQSYKWLTVNAKPIFRPGEEHPYQVFCTMHDITERRVSESINLSRLHLVQFAQSHSLDELLEETLNEAEKLTGSLIGFYHFVEEDQERLTLQNWSTRTKSMFCRAEGKGSHYPISAAGVWVDCVSEKIPVIHNDYASLPHRKGMPNGHAQVIREMVIPILRGEKIKAILGVGNKPTDYDPKDVEAVTTLANLAWEITEIKRTEQALQESEIRLREMNAAKDKFFSIIAHDLKSPFSAILGFSNLLVEQLQARDYDTAEQYAGIIQSATHHAMNLLTNLMEWTRSQRGLLAFDPQTIQLEQLLSEVMSLFKETILLKSISFVLEITPGMTLWADKQMISTILRNLLSNAIKYSHPGGKIVISARQDREEFILSVRDFGVGISPEIQNKLFRMEKNISTPGTLKETGTGLGVLLCKEFTERHHGRIWVESDAKGDSGERGSTFTISLPNPLPGRIQA